MSRPKGFKHTQETKVKIAEAHRGVSRPSEMDAQKQKIAKAMREWHNTHPHPLQGKQVSEETKMKISFSQRGNKNGNWKGGLTELIKGIRRSPELYQWRKAVLERDNHTCQDCGGTKNIAAHHIKPVIEYPKLIFNTGNGLTLCRDCHKIHTAWMWLRMKRRKRKNGNEVKPIH